MKKVKSLEVILLLALVSSYFYYRFHLRWIFLLGLSIGLLGLFIPGLANIISKAWYKLAEYLGWVSSRIILTLIFYLLLTPIALLSRLFGKDSMKLKQDRADSLYSPRNHKFSKRDLKNMW